MLCRSLPESFLREDDVFTEVLRNSVEISFRSVSRDEGSHHVISDELQCFDVHEVYNDTLIQSNFVKTVLSRLDDLKSPALHSIAHLLTQNKVKFYRTRPKMKKIICKKLPKIFVELSLTDCVELLAKFPPMFKEPSNYREGYAKLMTPISPSKLMTPISPSLLSSIRNILEGIADQPPQTLVAMFRKLKRSFIVPQFQLVWPSKSQDLLAKRVKRKCEDFLSCLEDGDELPKPLAKALAIACLSVKRRSRISHEEASDFFPFPSEVKMLQDSILTAIWSLPKFDILELKELQSLLDPNGYVSGKSFKTAVKRYLIEYLFECSDVDIPNSFLKTLAFINGRSRHGLLICSKKTIEEETDCVLNVSSQLKQIIWDLFPGNRTDEEFVNAYMEEGGGNAVNNNDEIKSAGNEYCASFIRLNVLFGSEAPVSKPEHLQRHASLIDNEIEDMGDSGHVHSFIPTFSGKDGSQNLTEINVHENGIPVNSDEIEGNVTSCSSDLNGYNATVCLKESMLSRCQESSHETINENENQYLSIQDACDETSLVAHRLIGRLLEGFLNIEGKDIDVSTRSYLRGGASTDFEDGEKSWSSVESNKKGQILIQAVEELIPSFPKSGIERVKELMGLR
ncbi:hypothetical protein QJS04_geneDACA009389 [Acorus gramineus]|uniref:Uncharacterized protein n=1 Tax=Acorus gramineus TaxID=55184 RepID=A0AAV9AGB7_ACOGR|nr:hypothetical protein QJS04_geneDACA009389 [Acorus gramineus]